MVWLCRNLGGVHASFCPVKLCPGLACLPSLLSDTQYGLQVAWSFWCLLLRNVALLVLLHFLMETGAAWVVLHLISCPGLACHFAEYGVSKFAFQDHTHARLCCSILIHWIELEQHELFFLLSVGMETQNPAVETSVSERTVFVHWCFCFSSQIQGWGALMVKASEFHSQNLGPKLN